MLVIFVNALRATAKRPADAFPTHHHPAGRTCRMSGEPVRARHLVHPCVDCAALPMRPKDDPGHVAVQPDWRPPSPRSIAGKRRCKTHLREHERALKEGRRDRYREKTYGITKEEFAELRAAQGDGCACGLTHGRSRVRDSSAADAVLTLATDHDHDRQAECVAAGRHDADTCCRQCVRGALGRRCNTEIVGRFTPDQLRRLADYIEYPTAQRLGWWDRPLEEA